MGGGVLRAFCPTGADGLQHRPERLPMVRAEKKAAFP